ncbi:MAG: tetratricopeptide repeat protein [Xanthomonadales bacterium]|nr:tetratricopeptide repeat protein [Xanthomonadales bacterium]
MKAGFAVLIFGLVLSTAGIGQTLAGKYQRDDWNRSVTDCDRLAAHPSDPEAVATGVSSSEVDHDQAIAACRAAVTQDPDNPRLNYQLGRTLGYAGRYEESKPYLARAAEAGYPQALFVLGYVEVTGWGGQQGDPCRGGELIRESALTGRFAGLVGFPHYALQGKFHGCGEIPRREPSEMLDFLAEAAPRAADFYQRLLVEQLTARLCRENPGVRHPQCPAKG